MCTYNIVDNCTSSETHGREHFFHLRGKRSATDVPSRSISDDDYCITCDSVMFVHIIL